MHRFPLRETAKLQATRSQSYCGWTIWNYREWVRTLPFAAGSWQPRILATDGTDILLGEAGNIRKQIEDMVSQQETEYRTTQSDLANIHVQEIVPEYLTAPAPL